MRNMLPSPLSKGFSNKHPPHPLGLPPIPPHILCYFNPFNYIKYV